MKINLHANIFSILKCYLTDGSFVISISNHLSFLKGTNSGDLQGSILGWVLFQVFTSDILTTANTKLKTCAYDWLSQSMKIEK